MSTSPRPIARAAVLRAVLWGVAVCGLCAFLAATPTTRAAEIAWQARVVDLSGEPLAGVRATLLPVRGADEEGRRMLQGGGEKPLAVAVSSADGSLALRRPADVPTLLRLTARDHPSQLIHLFPGPARSGVHGELTMVPDRGLRLRVVDEAGEPVAGARVHVSPPVVQVSQRGVQTVTGKDGRATVPRVTGGGFHSGRDSTRAEVVVRVLPPAGHAGLAPAPYRRTRESDLEVTLPAARPRALDLRLPGGEPAAGVVALLVDGPLSSLGPALAMSDERGVLRLPQPVSGEPLSLHLVAEDRSWSRLRWPVGETSADAAGSEPLTVTLQPPTRVHLRVTTTPEDTPVAGATVHLYAGISATSSAAGRADLRLPYAPDTFEGQAWALVYRTGYERAVVDLADGTGSPRQPVPVRLQPRAVLAGRVTDAEERAIAGAEIAVYPDYRSDRHGLSLPAWPIPLQHVGSDPEGRFEIVDLPSEQPLRLRVEAAGHAPEERFLPALGPGEARRDLAVTLSPGRRATAVVLSADGRPVPGAHLTLTPHATGGGDLSDELPLACDAEGVCRARGLSPGAFDLEADAPGHAPTMVRGVAVPVAPADAEFDLGTLYLDPAAALAGRVADSDGSPVAGAVVRAHSIGQVGRGPRDRAHVPSTTSDDGGAFRIGGLADGQAVHLTVDAPGYESSVLPSVQAPQEDLEVTLNAAAVVAGIVVDETGEPLPGVSVHVIRRPWSLLDRHRQNADSGHSDEEGRFEIPEAPTGSVQLRAHGVDHEDTLDLELSPGEVRRGLRFELRRREKPLQVTGRVVDGAGEAVPRASVELRVQRSDGGSSTGTRTDDDGSFTLALGGWDGRAPLTRLSLLVDHPDFLRQRRSLEEEAGEELTAGGVVGPLEIVLETGGAEVSGVVLGDDGTPLSDVRVTLVKPPDGLIGSIDADHRSTVSGDDGTFQFSGVEPATWAVTASHPSWADLELDEPIRVDGQPVAGLRLVLERGTRLVGRVRGLDERQRSEVMVTAGLQLDPHRHTSLSGRPDFRGEVVMPGAVPGTWRVTARTADGLREVLAEAEVLPGQEEVEVELDFGSGATVSGSLVINGKPRGGATVSLLGDRRSMRRAVTDVNGGFRFEGVPDGEYQLSVSSPPLSREVTVRGDTEVLLEGDSGVLAGRVVDSRGDPVTADVEWERLDSAQPSGGAYHRVSSFHFEVATGSYGLRVDAADHLPAELQVTVGPGSPSDDLRIVLEGGDRAVLQVSTGGASPPRQVRVAVRRGPVQPTSGDWYPVGPDGRVEVGGLPTGRSELLIGAPGRAVARVAVEVPGAVVPVVLTPPASLVVRAPALADTSALVVLGGGTGGEAGGGVVTLDEVGHFVAAWSLRDGTARIDGLPAGTWTVQVNAGRQRIQRPVTLTAGAVTELVVE